MMVSIITCFSSHLPSSSTEVYTVLTIDIHTVATYCRDDSKCCLYVRVLQLQQVCEWTLAQCKEQNIGELVLILYT